MKKRLLTLLFTVVFCVTSVAPGFAMDADDAATPAASAAASAAGISSAADQQMPAADKIAAMEKILYGTEQPGALVTRMDSLEDDVYGTVTSDAILDRIDNLFVYLKGNSGNNEAGFLTKLNAIEWQFNESMSGGPAKTRIESVEKMLNGKVGEGSLSSRLETLANIAFTDGNIAVESVTLPKDSVVKVEFTQELSSRTDQAGAPVHFKIADNVYVNDVLVLPKGAMGEGTIKKVVQPRSFGRDARIDLNFSNVYALDGTKVPVYIGEIAKQKAETAAGAAGVAIGGMILLGPIGALGGAFVTGQAVVIPVGSATYVQTTEDMTIQGMIYQGK